MNRKRSFYEVFPYMTITLVIMVICVIVGAAQINDSNKSISAALASNETFIKVKIATWDKSKLIQSMEARGYIAFESDEKNYFTPIQTYLIYFMKS